MISGRIMSMLRNCWTKRLIAANPLFGVGLFFKAMLGIGFGTFLSSFN